MSSYKPRTNEHTHALTTKSILKQLFSYGTYSVVRVRVRMLSYITRNLFCAVASLSNFLLRDEQPPNENHVFEIKL